MQFILQKSTNPDATILIETKPVQLHLNMASIFDIPNLGSTEIDRIIENHKKRLDSLENSFKPSLIDVKEWAMNQFKILTWLKIAIGHVVALSSLQSY